MQTYIALLRGINVSGQKKIKMSELKTHLEKLPLEGVQTYIQSGNIVFQAIEKESRQLEKMIEQQIQQAYDFEVSVIVKTPAELNQALQQHPFQADNDGDVKKLYFTFLAEEPTAERIDLLKAVDYSPEAYHLDGKNIYLCFPEGYGRAKINNNFFESKLKVAATTRNWNTVQKLYEMSQAY